jgi:DNA-binding NarL/FixJ family response regulator
VVGWTSDPEISTGKILFHDPDLVMVDLFLKDLSGLRLVTRLSKVSPKLPILVDCISDDPAYALLSLNAGARGFVHIYKEEPEGILQAVRQLLKGETFLSAALAAAVAQSVAKRDRNGLQNLSAVLSPRELMVFHLIGKGNSTAEIAANLALRPKTVLAHRAHIQRKLGLATSSRLVQQAVQWISRQGI